ncbi:winged helix-turn-helix domain-containing protein [Paracoccus sp. N5]|uniref:winged helix-turn-helix domain-containing protein n=1 Tax=Paracoccus sp. N5 TaxID=1101189 RepID=UPI0012FA46CF|nr:winged helix-turn-helix domain-containing protein [Paracoccus sp. N5]
MSSYLDVAQQVLLEARMPLTAKSILRLAFQRGLVPYHLHGKTQHKTLQARLSTDILHHREQSLFYRTEPGKFFLRSFMTDATIPGKYRREMIARRRTRDLLRGPALAIEKSYLCDQSIGRESHPSALLSRIRANGWYQYVEPKNVPDGFALLWSIAAVRRGNLVLTYRTGRYRDNRDSFSQKRSICFASLVKEEDGSLFDQLGFGVIDAALTAAAVDLNVPIDRHQDHQGMAESFSHRLWCVSLHGADRSEVLAYIDITAPEWFEPAQTRLSINDLVWMDISKKNDLNDFDPWSRSLVENFGSRGWHDAEARSQIHS